MNALSLSLWLTDVASVWETMLTENGFVVELEIPSDVGQIQGNDDYLQRVINNLLDNQSSHQQPIATRRHLHDPRECDPQ
jgi:hypothetical protein